MSINDITHMFNQINVTYLIKDQIADNQCNHFYQTNIIAQIDFNLVTSSRNIAA